MAVVASMSASEVAAAWSLEAALDEGDGTRTMLERILSSATRPLFLPRRRHLLWRGGGAPPVAVRGATYARKHTVNRSGMTGTDGYGCRWEFHPAVKKEIEGLRGLSHGHGRSTWDLIEELSALRHAWEGAYATTAHADAPLAWHERFAAARARLADCVSRTGCRPGAGTFSWPRTHRS